MHATGRTRGKKLSSILKAVLKEKEPASQQNLLQKYFEVLFKRVFLLRELRLTFSKSNAWVWSLEPFIIWSMKKHTFQMGLEVHTFQMGLEVHTFQMALEVHTFQMALEVHTKDP
jgi:hypothetical protein